MSKPLRIALTPGEPAGIGPDLAIMLAQSPRAHELVIIANAAMLAERSAALKLPLAIRAYHNNALPQSDIAGSLCVADIAMAEPAKPGVLNANNAPYVLKCVDNAIEGCTSGHYAAMVTGPIHKGIINDAGIAFTGHTEYLADVTHAYPVMMLTAGILRVALATTHLPLNKVAAAITEETLTKVIHILHTELRSRFAIESPRILVCGLNPHAGEGGHLGMEEINIIEPTLESLRQQGMSLIGPLPADTLFTPQHLDGADAVLAMFHDQGLPVLKYAGFGKAINVTLGLPIIRTSVDHGTALDKAATGAIDEGSLHAALGLAIDMAEAELNIHT
ncbi:MAG: 4-hydroxythreonine-4-phosphate dehydrogenase PdxA [Granulosicoccaceae bacterium]